MIGHLFFSLRTYDRIMASFNSALYLGQSTDISVTNRKVKRSSVPSVGVKRRRQSCPGSVGGLCGALRQAQGRAVKGSAPAHHERGQALRAEAIQHFGETARRIAAMLLLGDSW